MINLQELTNKNITIPAILEKQTEKAYCFFLGKLVWRNGGLEKEIQWLLKSITRFDKLNNQVTMPKWFAEKRKLI